MKYMLRLLLLLLFLVVAAISGCSTTPDATPVLPEAQVPHTENSQTITSLGLFTAHAFDWGRDGELDSLSVTLVTTTKDSTYVEPKGRVSAMLWLQPDSSKRERGPLVEAWTGIQIQEKDYVKIIGAFVRDIPGANVRLEYNDYEPRDYQYGVLEVTLTTPEGKSFTDTKFNVKLGGFPGRSESEPEQPCCP